MRVFHISMPAGRRDLPVSMHPYRRDLGSRCARSAGACPPRAPSSSYVFMSFSTYMSIETRAGPTSRSFRSLIKNTRRMAKPIKDLKDLRILRVCAGYRHSGPTDLKRTRDVFSRERWRGTGPRPTVKGGFSPPVARGPVPRERWSARAMARGTRSPARMETCEGPRPTMKGGFLSPRPR